MRQQRKKAAPTRQQRQVSADKPCSRCGKPIYFGYKGPIEGVCGKCTDSLRPRRKTSAAPRVRLPRKHRRRGTFWLLLLVFAAGTAVAVFGRPYLPWF